MLLAYLGIFLKTHDKNIIFETQSKINDPTPLDTDLFYFWVASRSSLHDFALDIRLFSRIMEPILYLHITKAVRSIEIWVGNTG